MQCGDDSNVLLRSDTQRCLEVIREREKLYCLLRQTDPQGLRAVGPSWSIDPGTRYTSRQFTFNSSHVARLYRSVIGGTQVTASCHVSREVGPDFVDGADMFEEDEELETRRRGSHCHSPEEIISCRENSLPCWNN